MNRTADAPTITRADLDDLKFILAAQLSPDGQMAVYAVTQPDREADAEYVNLWVVSLNDGSERALTSGPYSDTNPQWSPDGRTIAFLSDRSETRQIHLVSVEGGEPTTLTALEPGVEGAPSWSPDGTRLAFSARRMNPTDLSNPFRASRPTLYFDSMGFLENAVHDIYVIDVEGGAPQQLTDDGFHNSAPAWRPDGLELLFSSSHHPDSLFALPSLRVVNLEGQVRSLMPEWGYADAGAWLPDGSAIAFLGQPEGRAAGAHNDLWVIPESGGAPICRSESLTLGVGGYLQPDMPGALMRSPKVIVARDGRSAFVQVQDGGTTHIYRISLHGEESHEAIITGERSAVPLDIADQTLLWACSTLNHPINLFAAFPDGSSERQITHLNHGFETGRTHPVTRRISFSSSEGISVEGWILTPTAGAAPFPTILYVHGGPHQGFGHMFSVDFHLLAARGYAVLFINQRGSTGYGDDFASAIIGQWGTLDYIDVMAGVDYVIDLGLADPDRLGCCGLSAGGFLTSWIVGHTNRFRAAVPENPVTNWVSFYGVSDIGPRFASQELGGHPHEIPDVYQRCSPITHAHRCTTPTLLIQGESDYRCPAEQSEQFYRVLKVHGCVVEMVRLPGASHLGAIRAAPPIRRAQNDALIEWMDRYVLGSEPANRSGA